MRRLLLPLLAVGAAALTAFASGPSADEEAVEAAVDDFVEAFYHAKPELLERSVSAELKKMGYSRKEDGTYRGPHHMSFERATGLAAEWNSEGQQGDDLRYEVEVFEVLDKIANAKVTAKWGIDYFQLVKEDGRWKIHHVLWQTHPPKSGE